MKTLWCIFGYPDVSQEPPEVDDEDDAEATKSAEKKTVLLGKDAQELRVAQASGSPLGDAQNDQNGHVDAEKIGTYYLEWKHLNLKKSKNCFVENNCYCHFIRSDDNIYSWVH